MAAPTYNVSAIVVGKTKLGEADLVCTFMCEDGSEARAVAKGARKPASSFASRLELGCEVDLLCARGRTLDIVKEARLRRVASNTRANIVKSAGAACSCELLARIVQDGLEEPKLYAMTSVALAALESADEANAPAIVAAHLLKTLAFAGFRPVLDRCAICGDDADLRAAGILRLAPSEGGLVCGSCACSLQTHPLEAQTSAFAGYLIASRFSAIAAAEPCERLAIDALRFCQLWTREHIGCRLKSIDFMLGTALALR